MADTLYRLYSLVLSHISFLQKFRFILGWMYLPEWRSFLLGWLLERLYSWFCASRYPQLSLAFFPIGNCWLCQWLRNPINFEKRYLNLSYEEKHCFNQRSFKLSKKLTLASLTQIYFWLSRVTEPNLKRSGLRPKLVNLKTSLKLKGRFYCIGFDMISIYSNIFELLKIINYSLRDYSFIY